MKTKLFLILFLIGMYAGFSQERMNIIILDEKLNIIKVRVKEKDLIRTLDSINDKIPRKFYYIEYVIKGAPLTEIYRCKIKKKPEIL